MKCRDCELVLVAYLHDELAQGERREVTEHLASCPTCSESLDGFRRVRTVLAIWQESEPSPAMDRMLFQHVAKLAAERAWQKTQDGHLREALRRWWAVPALLGLGLAINLIWAVPLIGYLVPDIGPSSPWGGPQVILALVLAGLALTSFVLPLTFIGTKR